MTDNINDIIEDIIKGKYIGVSYRCFKNKFGTTSWVIENKSGTHNKWRLYSPWVSI